MVECTPTDGANKGKRGYITVDGLTNPAYDKSSWNEKQGLFIAGEDAPANNQIVKSLLETLNTIIESCNVESAAQLKELYTNGVQIQAKKQITLGEFVAHIVMEMKAADVSSNTELYNTLHNILKGENRKGAFKSKIVMTFTPAVYNGKTLYDTPLSELSNAHFVAFGQWIIAEHKGCGYKNLMTTFKAVVNKANERFGYSINLTYRFRKSMPKPMVKPTSTAKEKLYAKGQQVTMLSSSELEAFEDFDVSTLITNGNKRNIRLAQLYKDLVLLMYYTLARPADVISWKNREHYDAETNQIVYNPHKLRNRQSNRYVNITLNNKAKAIVDRYNGKSKGGYILPLPMNETCWDITNQFHAWDTKKKGTESRINAFLKKVAAVLGFTVTDLSLYDFRHTAITHAVNAKELTAFEIAQRAGTSVEMIEKHYYNGIVA